MVPSRKKVMKILDKETILSIPFHDSDLLDIRIEQNAIGETDLILSVMFPPDCIADLQNDMPSSVGPNGASFLKFSNCRWISANLFCDLTRRDEIDYIDFIHSSKNIPIGFDHIEIQLISGSRIECYVKNLMICGRD